MTFDTLTRLLADQQGLPHYRAKEIARDLFGLIAEAADNGDTVSIPQFGTFQRRHRAERTVNLLGSGERVRVREQWRVAFRAGKGARWHA